MGGGLAMLRIAWCLLLDRCNFGVVPALAPRAPIAPVEPVAAVEAIATPLVAVAIPVDLTHQGRGPFLVLIDANGEIAQHVFGEALLPLDLGQRGGRRIELEQGEMRLAVLADAEGERLDAPVFRVADKLATKPLDDALEVGRHFLDLLRAEILARQIDVFVQWHGMPFPCVSRVRRQAPRALREGREVLRKAGTLDAGPCGPAGPWQGRPSVQLPAGIERRARVIAGFRAKARVGARKSSQQELSDDVFGRCIGISSVWNSRASIGRS